MKFRYSQGWETCEATAGTPRALIVSGARSTNVGVNMSVSIEETRFCFGQPNFHPRRPSSVPRYSGVCSCRYLVRYLIKLLGKRCPDNGETTLRIQLRAGAKKNKKQKTKKGRKCEAKFIMTSYSNVNPT
jgi:hypothetical protein